MKMRKSMEQALKWYNNNKVVKGTQNKVATASQQVNYKKQVVEITVVQGFNLRISGAGGYSGNPK